MSETEVAISRNYAGSIQAILASEELVLDIIRQGGRR